MNRGKAKLLTTAGIGCCLFALTLLVFNVADIAVSYFSPLLFFVGGIVLTVISLAYYTEK